MIKRIIFLFILLLFISSIGDASNSYLHSTYWRPDANGYAGSIHIYLKNSGGKPMRVEEVHLNGRNIGLLVNEDILKKPVEFRSKYIRIDHPEVEWYRVWPNPIPGLGVCEIIIRLTGRHVPLEGKVDIITSAGKIKDVVIKYKPSPFYLSYVAFSPNLDEVHVYVHKRAQEKGMVKKVFMDGKDVTRNVRIFSPAFFHSLSYVKLNLEKPLIEGSYHTFTVETDTGERASSLIRTIPPFFAIGTWANPGLPDAVEHMTNWWFGSGNSEELKKVNFKQSPSPGGRTIYDYEKETKEKVFAIIPKVSRSYKDDPTVYCYYMEDEPDGRRGCSGSVPKDVARGHELVAMTDTVHPTWVQMDHSGYPSNFYRFGLICDILCSHVYSNNFKEIKDHNYHLKEAAYPRPFHWITGVYLPTTVEMKRIETYYALMGGAKGILYYPLHSPKGLLADRSVWDGLKTVNAELQMLGNLIIKSELIPSLAKCNEDTLEWSALLAGDEAIILLGLNTDFHYDEKGNRFTCTPGQNIRVELSIPEWFDVKDAFVVGWGGPERIKYQEKGNKATLMFSQIEVTKVLVVARDRNLFNKISEFYVTQLKDKLTDIEREEEK